MRAFPTQNYETDGNGNVCSYQLEGMDLRDYFAAKAMEGLIVGINEPRFYTIAAMAYEAADAMMEARKK